MNKIKTLLLVVSLATIPVVLFAQEMPPTLVVTETVTSHDFHDQLTLVGRTEAFISSQIVSEVAGRVESIEAAEGVWVVSNTPLVKIDAERTRLTFEAKQAEADRARAMSELAAKDLERSKDLFDRSLIPESRYDSVRAAATIAEQSFNQLRAERDRLALDVEHCTLSAPFSGYTVRKLVDVGEWVNVGTPVYEMVDLSKIKVVVDLPEKYFGHVAIGSPVQITLAADGIGTVNGKVTGIAPNAGEATHTFPVIVTVDNRKGVLGGGMLVKASLNLSDRFTSLAVSKDAIVRQGSQTMVYTVNEGKAVPIPVTTTSSDGKMVAINGQGLAEGMPVVVRGNERIFPGAPVRLSDAASGSEAEAATESSESKS